MPKIYNHAQTYHLICLCVHNNLLGNAGMKIIIKSTLSLSVTIQHIVTLIFTYCLHLYIYNKLALLPIATNLGTTVHLQLQHVLNLALVSKNNIGIYPNTNN